MGSTDVKLAAIRAKNRENRTIGGVPHPFVKWAGGKRQLLKQLEPYLPASITSYVEPFVGGGAMFYYLLPDRAVLIDNNPMLINAYRVIKNNVEELIEQLQNHRNESEYYYSVRGADRTPEFAKWSPVQKASRILFMNKCCFNGLFRVNSKGFFNVPFGKYKNPNFCDAENLRAVHEILQNVEIVSGSFERVLEFAKSDSFVYFDPPYVPLSKTAHFTGYTKESFGEDDQRRLKEVFHELDKRGCQCMLSNSSTPLIQELFEEYTIKIVKAKRAINRNANARGAIDEIVVMNYF